MAARPECSVRRWSPRRESQKNPGLASVLSQTIATPAVLALMKMKEIALNLTPAAVRGGDVNPPGRKRSARVSFNAAPWCCGLLFPLLSCAEDGPGPVD